MGVRRRPDLAELPSAIELGDLPELFGPALYLGQDNDLVGRTPVSSPPLLA